MEEMSSLKRLRTSHLDDGITVKNGGNVDAINKIQLEDQAFWGRGLSMSIFQEGTSAYFTDCTDDGCHPEGDDGDFGNDDPDSHDGDDDFLDSCCGCCCNYCDYSYICCTPANNGGRKLLMVNSFLLQSEEAFENDK